MLTGDVVSLKQHHEVNICEYSFVDGEDGDEMYCALDDITVGYDFHHRAAVDESLGLVEHLLFALATGAADKNNGYQDVE